MRYWVIKGNPAENDWDELLVPGTRDVWHTGRVPAAWARGDRLFCWESAPHLRIVGLATLLSTNLGEDQNGDRLFSVRYLTRRLRSMPTIGELRRVPELATASFLKTGPATTLFPLSDKQAEVLLGLIVARNPEIAAVWSDAAARVAPGPDLDDAFAEEGSPKLVAHLVRERDRGIVQAKKSHVLAKLGALRCEVCDFDFSVAYPGVGNGYCEVHHRTPLSQTGEEVRTTLRDLAIVCSNCHRMLHHAGTLTVQQLRAKVSRARRTAT